MSDYTPKRKTTLSELRERNSLAYKLRKSGNTLEEIAHNPKIIELSGGFILTRERINQVVCRYEKKIAKGVISE